MIFSKIMSACFLFGFILDLIFYSRWSFGVISLHTSTFALSRRWIRHWWFQFSLDRRSGSTQWIYLNRQFHCITPPHCVVYLTIRLQVSHSPAFDFQLARSITWDRTERPPFTLYKAPSAISNHIEWAGHVLREDGRCDVSEAAMRSDSPYNPSQR